MHNDPVGYTEKRCNLSMNAKSHQGRMDFGHGKLRENLEDDRLSSLPDDLIHKILSLINLEEAIGTSVLSTRWRSIWKSMLNLTFVNFVKIDSPRDFSKFVYNVLSHRNNQIQLSSVYLFSEGKVSHEFVKRFIEYVITHNVQQLTVSWSPENEVDFPLSLYSCRSLKHLDLHHFRCNASYLATPAWDLPALTTLELCNITVSDKCTDLFSKFPNLKNLKLDSFTMMEINVFDICHPQLSNLTLEWTYWGVEVVNVVAPQLKNLTIKHGYGKHLIYALGLTSLVIEGDLPLQLIATEGFPSLEKVDLHIYSLRSQDAPPNMVSLFQQLHSVKHLTINFDMLRTLSSSTGLMSNQLSPFANFKIVKFLLKDRLKRVFLEVGATTSLLDSSDQSAVFPMVSREDIKVMGDIVLVKLLIAINRFGVQKHKRKALTDTNHMEQVNAPTDSNKRKMDGHGKAQVKKQMVQSAFEKRWHFGEMMAQIKQGKREGLLKRFPTYDTCRLISLLQQIDELVTELSGSNRPAIQATFSIICEEAAVVINNILDRMKIPYNKKRKRSKVKFHEHTTINQIRSMINCV